MLAAHMQRRRLGSVGDSAPPSESSESANSSEHNELMMINPDWSTHSHHSHNSHNSSVHTHTLSHTTNTASTATNNTGNVNLNNSYFIAGSDVDADTLSTDTTSNSNLSEYERGQVESFFGGLGTDIFVCSSLANLYEGSNNSNGNNAGGGGGNKEATGDWRLVFTGIPVILHDRGNARSRAVQRVTLVLAERGSCFALWSDRIDNLSSYRVAGPSFHTMCLSTNHQQLIGFSFDSTDSARELYHHIEKLISDPENIALSVPGKKKQKQKRVKPAPLPPKSQISQPCQFQHVTSVTKEDTDRYYSMQAFAPPAVRHR